MYVLNFNCVVLGIRMYGRDHLSINTVAIGFSEIIGVFIGMYIVLYTSRRWLWAGSTAIITGLLGYFIWFIPRTSKQLTQLSKLKTYFIQNLLFTFSFSERDTCCCIRDGTNDGHQNIHIDWHVCIDGVHSWFGCGWTQKTLGLFVNSLGNKQLTY